MSKKHKCNELNIVAVLLQFWEFLSWFFCVCMEVWVGGLLVCVCLVLEVVVGFSCEYYVLKELSIH